MTSRQVQWRRFTFFDKDTIAEDVALELGAEVTCMHTAAGRLYLGDGQGKVTISNSLMGGKTKRQAYSGAVHALSVALEGVPPGTGTASTGATPLGVPGSASGAAGSGANSKKASRGVVVTLGDDSVLSPMSALGSIAQGGLGAAGAPGSTAGTGLGVASGSTPPTGFQSPFVLKFWAGLDMAVCIRTVDVAAQLRDPGQHQTRWAGASGGLARLTAFAVTTDAMQVACGFSDGTALLLQRDLARGPQQSQPPPLRIQPGDDKPSAVTALHFSRAQGGSGLSQTKLLVGYDLDERDHGRDGVAPSPGSLGLLSYDTRTDAEPLVLDELGCKERCSAFGQATQEMVVGRNDGVYFFSSEDRGGAAGFDGTKQHVGCLWNYILVVSRDPRSSRHTMNIYDMRNKLVAFHVLLPQGQAVKLIACQGERFDPNALADGPGVPAGPARSGGEAGASGGGGLAFVLTDRNALLRLRERDTPSKLELLFRKNLYPMAISLAYASDHDVSEILGIYRMYGDHLYKKGDFEGAMQQYKNTIGHLDPSYVVRRFLDAQRIGLLTAYLEALHDAGQASSDHTTLLLNCYTKLKDVEKLDRFIHPPDSAGSVPGVGGMGGALRPKGGGGSEASANFEVVTAISVLKSAGHADHAAELARQHSEHDWFLRIQLERSQPDYQGALAYIASLPFSEAVEQLKRRGKPLVAKLPQETTGVLMALCTGRYERKADSGEAGEKKGAMSGSTRRESSGRKDGEPRPRAAAKDFVHLYVDEPKWLRIFLMYVVREGGNAGPGVADTLLELLLREWTRVQEGGGGGDLGRRDAGDDEDDSRVGLGERDSSSRDRRIGAAAVAKQMEQEIMSLLDNPRAGYDADHALALVQMLNFKPGQLYLYEKFYMTDLVLEHYVETGDTRNMIRMCRKEGTNNPDLWAQVLTHLVNKVPPARAGDGQKLPPGDADRGVAMERGVSRRGRRGAGDYDETNSSGDEMDEELDRKEAWDDVQELLALINRDAVLPPLQVVTILGQHPTLPLAVTRDFLPAFLTGAASAAAADASAAAELRESTRKMRGEIQSLRATVHSSSGASRTVAKELPTFLTPDGSKEPSKSRFTGGSGELGGFGGEQAKIQDIKAAQARSAVDHEQFFKGLEEAADGFAQVASYFGKGVLS